MRKSAAALAALLDENKDEQVLKEACLGLCQLFGEGIQNDRIQAILEADVVPKLVALLRPSKSRSVPIPVQSAALQVLGNVACGDDRQTQVVIDSDALPCLRALLSSQDRGIRKEVCWIVSNITESSHQVQDVLDADILPPLLKLLDSQDAACREDATWVLFNLSSNRDPNQIAYLAEKNGVRALCNLLTCSKELDVLWKGCGTVAAVALKGLRNILISGQIAAAADPNGYNRMASLVAEAHGVERIEALTTHVSLDVRTRARLLLERMFGAEPTTADLSPPLPPPAVTGLSSLSSPPPPPPSSHFGCSCSYSHHQQHPSIGAYHSGLYDVSGNINSHGGLHTSSHSSHGIGVEHGIPVHTHLHSEGDLVDVPGSSSGSSTDSDPEDDDSDSDLIPPPPAPCTCVLCTDPSPLAERRPRGKVPQDDPDLARKSSDDSRGMSGGVRQMCNFCSGGGRLGDGRAGLAAKLGRAVRLGHPHCLAVLLSRMTWSQRVAATEAPALLHPGGGPPDGGVGSSLPAVVLAAQLGKPECLGLLLRRCQPDLDVPHGKKRLTALAWAAHKGYMKCCQLLIEHGAKPSVKCGEGVTALHLAASGGGHIAICKLLIEQKAPVNARSAKRQTPLCLASQKGFGKVVQLLLEHGADANNEDETKYTPLHLSASNGFVNCVDLLLKAGARVDATTRNGVTPLHYAVQSGRAQVVKLLIAAGAKVNCDKKPLLLIAADDGNLEVVQILLDAQATIDCKANIKATLDKDVEVSDYLTPLHLASSRGHHDVVELLLRRGAHVNEVTNKSGWSSLDFAVLNEHADCAVTLLRYGAVVADTCKSIGRNNWTLVQYAAHHHEKELVRLLIQRVKEQGIGAGNGRVMSTANGTSDSVVTVLDAEDSVGIGNQANGLSAGPCEMDTNRLPTFNYPADGAETNLGSYMAIGEQPDEDFCHHLVDGDGANVSSYQKFDPKALDGDECAFVSGSRQVNESSSENLVKNTSRRRVVKDDRQNAIRAREIKKREAEATEARDRLEEAMSQPSITKLTEAIAHVSKLVLHLATTVGGDVISSGTHLDHTDTNGYSTHTETYSHGGHVHSSAGGNNKHSSGVSGSAMIPAPLAMEVGLGNKVQKARKMLAGLLAEEKRLREEKEREVEVTKRENTQQTVRKAIVGTLEGGDPRSLARVCNRAVRTILDKNDPIVCEAMSISTLISDLEKWEYARKSASEKKDLDGLAKALPEIKNAVTQLKEKGGEGAAMRMYGGMNPERILEKSSELLKELHAERESRIAKEAEAKYLERAAHQELVKAMKSDNIGELENALNHANAALLSKQSELSSAIESAKKVMAKRLKAERRRLRQANNTNDPTFIEKAVAVAEAFGLQSLQGDIDSAKEHAQKLRKQAEMVQMLEDAIGRSDVAILTDIRGQLNSLGMFAEAEKAWTELERLQRATRARTLLEGAIEDAKQCQVPFVEALEKSSTAPDITVELKSSWMWPDAQRLIDLSERARKHGQAMRSLCDSAEQLARDLAELGRRVLSLTTKSADATGIAAVISGYEKSFMNVSKPNLFNAVASELAIRQAKERLAEVQAMDQASVKAESAQVKVEVEYALATSRRSTTRHRGVKGSRAQAQGSNGSDGTYLGNLGSGPSGSTGLDSETRSPSSLSLDFADDDVPDSENAFPGLFNPDGTFFKANDTHRSNVMRRARVPCHLAETALLDGVGDVPAPIGECSHFYLFKEGNTVYCARCGHLRSSGNPEWLARVKRRGTKAPLEILAASLTSVGSAPDLQMSYPAVGPRVSFSNRSPPTGQDGTNFNERSVGRSGRGLTHGVPLGMMNNGRDGRDGTRGSPSLSNRANLHPGSMHMMAQFIQQQQQHQLQRQQHYQQSQIQTPQGRQQPSQQQHTQNSHFQQSHPSQAPGSSHAHGQGLPVSKVGQSYRGRSHNHISSIPTGLEQSTGALASIYGGGPGNGRGLVGVNSSLPLQSSYNGSPSIHALASGITNGRSGQMQSYGIGGSLSGLDPKSAMSVHGGIGVASGMSKHSVRLDEIGQAGRAAAARAGGARSTALDDVGVSGLDLGVDFANENFGFDIDAIVDDNPPPGPSKIIGSHEKNTSSEDGQKGFVASAPSKQNGYYQR